MKMKKRLLAIVLGVLVAMGTAGCNTEDTTWAYKYNEDTMPAGVYIMHVIEAYQMAEEKYMEEAYADAEQGEIWIYPEQKDVLASQIEGVGAGAWINAKAQELAQEYYGVQQLAGEMGYTLSESGVSAAQYNLESTWSGTTADAFTKNGVSENSMRLYLNNQVLKSELFEQIYGPGGSNEIPESEIAAILARDYSKVSLMEFAQEVPGEDEDQTDADAKNAELRELAESYGERLAAGEQVDDLIFEYRVATVEDGGNVEMPTKSNWQMTFLTENAVEGDTFYDAVLATEPGAYSIVDEDDYYVVVYRHDLSGDNEAIEQYRSIIATQQKGEEFGALLREKAAELNLEANQASLERYTVDKLKLDF